MDADVGGPGRGLGPGPGGGNTEVVMLENFSIAETVQSISPGYRFSTLARFREALDALVEGMRRAKQGGRDLL